MNKKLVYISFFVIAVFMLSFVASAPTAAVSDPHFKSNKASTKTDAWIVELQDNFDNPQWFYDNMADADRKMVRQALDYAVPRAEIISSILDGHGFLLATTVIPQTGIYYDASVVPRTFNTTASVELLTEAFGYEWAEGTDDAATPYDESLPYFKMTLTVPSTNPLRSQWAARISFAYLSIGVDIVYKQWTWTTIDDKIFVNPGFEANYDDGGFDAQFIGWGGGTLPGDNFFFHSSALSPNGGNYQGVNSVYMDDLIDLYDTTKNTTERIEAYFEFQEYFYDNAMRNILFQSELIFGLDTKLEGNNPYFGSSIQYQNLTFTNAQDTIVVARPGEFVHVNPFVSNSWYDNFVLGTTFYGMLTTSTPPGDLTYAAYESYNFFADWYNVSADELHWFFNLKTGLVFEDGSALNTSDVEFSYNSALNVSGGFPLHSTYKGQMNTTAEGGITVHNSTLIEFQLYEWSPFTLLTLWGLPIVSKAQMGSLPVDQWSGHQTDYNATMLGNGPYTFESVSNNVAYLANAATWTPSYYNKFVDVPYMASAIANAGVPEITNVTVVLINSADVALTALKTGEIDWIDSNTGLSSVFDQIVTADSTYQTYVGGSWQEFGLNQGSPIWGMNPIAPPVTTTTTSGGATTTTTGGATTTTTSGGSTPFGDIVTITAAFVVIGAFSYSLRKIIN
jgi:ABC-type transport system substrate-binding protein